MEFIDLKGVPFWLSVNLCEEKYFWEGKQLMLLPIDIGTLRAFLAKADFGVFWALSRFESIDGKWFNWLLIHKGLSSPKRVARECYLGNLDIENQTNDWSTALEYL